MAVALCLTACGDTTPVSAARPDAAAVGVYSVHPDPLVGYVLRPGLTQWIHDAPVHSDALGLRVPPGPPPPADAEVIAVLGDSVAFGYGLADDETIAARLAVVLADARSPGARPVACRTVAMPGWNHANATHFLLDHLDALSPDIVIYVPVGNDLLDTDGMNERGMRRAMPDIAQRDPWLSVYQGSTAPWIAPLLRDVLGDPEALARRLGPPALEVDLSPESSTRYDAWGASVALLAGRLAERGARLMVAPYIENRPGWHLAERLLAMAPEVPRVPLFTGVPPEFTLGDDPHPDAESAAAMATWLAADLLERGWVSAGASRSLPEVDTARRAKRAVPHTPDEVSRVCAELRAQDGARLRRVVDMTTADGQAQVYGGLNEDGSAGARLSLLLARPSGPAALELQLGPVVTRPDLYPLAVRVEADGVLLGIISMSAPEATGAGTTSVRLDLPEPTMDPSARGGAPGAIEPASAVPMELKLVPERWVTADVRGRQALVSFRPLRFAAVER